MIYDCFLFFNEFDLLDIRLHELADAVDRFVLLESTRTFTFRQKLLESTRTFTFRQKPLHFAEQIGDGRFDWIGDRLTVIGLDEGDFQGIDRTDPWWVEANHRELLVSRLGAEDHDVVILSDADEIPSATFVCEAHHKLKRYDPMAVFQCEQWLSWYYLNCLCGDKWTAGTRATTGKRIRMSGMSGEELRKARGTTFREGGWHFSYLGDIQEKLASFAHAEFNKPPFNTPEHIARCKAARVDLFGRTVHQPMQIVKDLSFLPRYVQENPEKFKHLLA
jgi:beta-1,4-mannosyl-glycoprotein beta-1,4-N-acetylglucosaminyltransferase